VTTFVGATSPIDVAAVPDYGLPVAGSLHMSNLIHVPFGEQRIEVIEEPNGSRWVVLRPECQRFGMSFPRQFRKLKSRPWATVAQKATVGADAKRRRMACLNLEAYPMWLATLDTEKVGPRLRAMLEDYQKHAGKVLWDYFSGRDEGRKYTGEGALVRLLLNPPGVLEPWQRRFEPTFVKLLNKLYRNHPEWDGGIQPKYLGAIWHKLYPLIVSSEVYREMRARERKGTLHQQIKPENTQAFVECLKAAETLAQAAQTPEEWWDYLEHKFGGSMLQLALVRNLG